MYSWLIILATLASTILGAPHTARSDSQSIWNVDNFLNLVTFGDSYTDENRLNYIFNHNGSYPPYGTFLPETFSAPSGGRTWPRYVIQYTGDTVSGQWDPKLELYDYAVSGAVCSNLITPRTIGASLPGVLFPSVLEYEVPAYLADKSLTRNGTTQPYYTVSPTSTNSIYALWIGTNDLGVNAFLTNSQIPGKTLTDYTDCIYSVFDGLYASGARVFVLMNTIPLELTPLYANDTLHGTDGPHSEYWLNKPANKTEIAELIREYTSTVNNVFKYQTPFEALVAQRYPGASWALFDVHSLFEDIYQNPAAYLNGTVAVNVTGYENQCVGASCVDPYSGGNGGADSFLWYDALHPSEQTDRIIARNFIEVVNGSSQYATYY